MMGYEGRSLLVDDGEEWVNIPLVVREFMRQLNDEVHASRSAMEAVRQEQKEVNLCLRRVMQKQADLDMDNARTTLHLKRNSQDAAQTRHSEQIHSLRKKQARLDEKLQQLTAKVSAAPPEATVSSSGPSRVELSEKLNALSDKIKNCEGDVKAQAKVASEARQYAEDLVASKIAAAAADITANIKSQVGSVHLRLASSETSITTHQEALEQLQQESKRLRGVCGELSDIVDSDRRVNKERLTTCLQTIEKAETLCAAHQSGVEATIARLESAVENNAEKLRDEAKTSYVELRELLKSSQHDVVLRCNELTEELLSVREQQKRLHEQLLSADGESATTRLFRATKELSQRVTQLEDEAEQRTSDSLIKRDFERFKQETQGAMDVLRVALEETKAASQAQHQQLGQSMKAMRAEQREDNDWLHNELGRMGTVLSHASQQRERHERQVTSLCDIAHNLSVAVETLQAERGSRVGVPVTVAGRGAPGKPAAHDGAPASTAAATALTGESDTALPASPSWEALRVQIVKEAESTLSAAQQRFERLSQQLNELTAKVDGGARYAQAIVAQHMDNVRQCVKDEVSQQLHAHPAVRELTPALVDLEAAKRRVASLELEVQSAAIRSERLSADDAARLSDTGASASALLHRVESLEDSVTAIQRRTTELSVGIEEHAQHRSSVTRSVRQLDARLQDQERVTAKFGADLTAALESVLHTGESFSQLQATSTSQFGELRSLVTRCKDEVSALRAAQAASNTAQNAQQADQQGAVHRLESEVARLSSAVEGVAHDVAAEVVRQVRPIRDDLEALRQECAASTERSASSVTRFTRDLATLKESRDVDELRAVCGAVQKSQTDAAAELRALTERVSGVEATVAAAEARLVPAPPPPVPAGDLARFTKELQDIHHQLEAQQQRMSALDELSTSAAAEQEAAMRRECKDKLEALRGEMMAWVTTYVAAQLQRCRSEWQSAIEESAGRGVQSGGAHAAVSAAEVAELYKYVDKVSDEASDMAVQHGHELNEVKGDVDRIRASQAELRREVVDGAAARHAEHVSMLDEVRDALDVLREATAAAARPTADTAAHASSASNSASRAAPGAHRKGQDEEEEARSREWKESVLQAVHDAYYTKSLLEERLENIWSSMVTLLARKEDVAAVNEKLEGLHQLLQEELQIEMEKMAEQLSGQLAEKVSLAGLQDMLEEHFMEPGSADAGHRV